MKFSSLADWLGWLEQSHPKEIDLGLERIRQVAARMDLLNPRAKVITVAGTNGKGSCVTATAALLQAAGHSVGLYTSPHLLHYAERIQVNGQLASDSWICDAFDAIATACASFTPVISLTYFEYGTLAALVIFQRQNVDYMVLEVGLGGRLDAVNILDANLAVITSIALDHQDWLGDNREQIGREKAGILREQQWFVCADEAPPESVKRQAAELHARAYFIGDNFGYSLLDDDWQWYGCDPAGQVIQLPFLRRPHLPLPSMAAAIQAIHLLGISLSPAQIEQCLLALNLPGRFQQLLVQGRQWVLDVAHNPAATAYLATRLQAAPVTGKTFAIVAMMADKDREESLANLEGLVDEWYLLQLDIPRAATVAQLRDDVKASDAPVMAEGTWTSLVQQVMAKMEPCDRLLVFGSFFTVAEALAYVQAQEPVIRGKL